MVVVDPISRDLQDHAGLQSLSLLPAAGELGHDDFGFAEISLRSIDLAWYLIEKASANPGKSSPLIGSLYNGYPYIGYHSRGMEHSNFCWEREPAELYESVVHPGLNFQTPMISKEGKIINPMVCFWIDGSRCSSCLVQKKGIIIYVFAVSLSMNTADWLTLQDRYCWCNIGWTWGEKIEVRRNANSSSVNA